MDKNLQESRSEFTGGAFANFGVNFVVTLVSLITIGLAFPAMTCWRLRWKAKHTFIEGRQLVFDGTGAQLFGKYLLWLLLSVVTLGLYLIFAAQLKYVAWETKHTHFADQPYNEDENLSSFDGKWYQLFGVNFVANFVTIITLSFGMYWAHCYKERWYCKHKRIDGYQLSFDGKAGQYFGKCILWVLLTVITIGIYSFWLAVNILKWTTKHTRCEELASGNSASAMDASAPQPLYTSEYAAYGQPPQGQYANGQYQPPQGQYPQGQYPQGNYQPQQPAKTANGLSIAGFVLVMLGYFMPIGFILCLIGLATADKHGGSGKGLAIVGIVICFLELVIIILIMLFGVILPLANGLPPFTPIVKINM